jgi:hypothetical protein
MPSMTSRMAIPWKDLPSKTSRIGNTSSKHAELDIQTGILSVIHADHDIQTGNPLGSVHETEKSLNSVPLTGRPMGIIFISQVLYILEV